MEERFDSLVIGGGHAGVEAAAAVARMGGRVCLLTLDARALGRMSCNPAVGGLAKGQLVREIDALGALMGLAADRAGIQFRTLNASKGPAVRSPRVQVDRQLYNQVVVELIAEQPEIQVVEGEAVALLTEAHASRTRVLGCRLADGRELRAAATLLTTGTFLGGVLHLGAEQEGGGRAGEAAASHLSRELERLGLELARHKTGTPPRLDAESIDFEALEEQPGDPSARPFSRRSPGIPERQLSCYLTHTTAETHRILAEHAHLSAMRQGGITGVGPRYCPSVEDKIVRFPDRPSHLVFLEPEGWDSREVYPNGLSTSLPREVQEAFLHSIPGLTEARILRPGYAVEYDHLVTTQLRADLSVSKIDGLYAAGQINGTSGYEEAAAQGLVAGVNTLRHARGESPMLLSRSSSYIAVLIDDLCRVNPREPYRMFTSRAEHRLSLRQGNADLRLADIGARFGLIDEGERAEAAARERRIASICERLEVSWIQGKSLAGLLRRPGTRLFDLPSHPLLEECRELSTLDVEEVEARILYAPYLERHAMERERVAEYSERRLPEELRYEDMEGLKKEAREVLTARRPLTLLEAQGLPGVTPADLSVLLVALRRGSGNRSSQPVGPQPTQD